MSGDYEVGYKKPPLHTRFKKGQSGNGKGRPKGARNLRTELEEELQEKIVVREGQTRKEVSKQRAMLKSLTAKAMQGDTRAVALVVDMVYRLLHVDAPEMPDTELKDDDLSILKNYEKRIRHLQPQPGPAQDPSQGTARPDDGAVKGKRS
jgi:hypothetical protein